MSSPLCFGLIGAGGIGAYHLRSIQAQERAGAARLVAVADPMVARYPEVERELTAAGVRWYLDSREMLEREPELQVVTIATPIPFHESMARACLERGVFVNLEKPPVPLIQQLEGLISQDTGQRVSVGFQMIGSRGVQALKQLIAEGRLGKIRTMRAAGCWPRLDGYYQRASWAGRMRLNSEVVFDGPATNALAHLIHNIMFLAGEERGEFAIPEEVEGEMYRARPIESYDIAALRGTFPGGIAFSVAVTHATESGFPFRLAVEGSDGSALLSADGGRLETTCGVNFEDVESTQQLLDRNYEQFVAAIADGTHRFPTRLADTRGYVKTTNAMLLSSGGIHDVAPASVRRYSAGDEGGFTVENLREDVEASLLTGGLPSEWGRSWAVGKPRPILLDALESLAFDDLV